MAAFPTTTALWSSGLADGPWPSSLICWAVPMAFAFSNLTIISNHASASATSNPGPSGVNSSLPFWRSQVPNMPSEPKIEVTPNGTFALAATSVATSISPSQVQVVSSGISILAFSHTAGLAMMIRLLMPALMPTSLSSILPESTVPSMNLEVSTPLRSSSAPRLPYSEM